MAHDKDLYLEKNGSTATLVINRPHKRNAITHQMWKDLPGLAHDVDHDPSIKVLVVRGAGSDAFAAGADISEFKTLRADSASAKVYNKATHEAERALANLTKPTVAMIHGYCVGGGLELALACDLRFADDKARFAITPAKLGLVYSLTATKQLVDIVGPAKAKYILFSGLQLGANRAREIGLIDEVFAPEELDEKTLEFVELLSTRAQTTIRGTKRIVRLILEGQVGESEETTDLRNNSFDTDDYEEGVRAFLEKRPPQFR